ncbi:hypothetical protein A3I80_01365 [Candidatus Gottesmanbacteria bacterium RIFCSPLOWO2_02_FULL_40_10]|uniref:Uncharacterized protein n=1 Tax=Candidatus Gottesmanbacteria bacterium RIFCSPHIGHO2_01_FULL_40_15 TaxID=1798376 RepID=A0A1F5Z784_9BACT|nr:MAG: hypothetical protein A2777_06320 [Candidatus Gottesmanbacteria bacterium RIFCSPHIGHO2_01_FULL_40_15]OGG33889.1 MAG: hypothetical protein A3I80_01365 [Candidatus Gottesmanbacteria bacterium RIFCSPLOWO2_02_FULL_40_10]
MKVGEITRLPGRNQLMSPFMKVVLPAPKSPKKANTSPPFSREASLFPIFFVRDGFSLIMVIPDEATLDNFIG